MGFGSAGFGSWLILGRPGCIGPLGDGLEGHLEPAGFSSPSCPGPVRMVRCSLNLMLAEFPAPSQVCLSSLKTLQEARAAQAFFPRLASSWTLWLPCGLCNSLVPRRPGGAALLPEPDGRNPARRRLVAAHRRPVRQQARPQGLRALVRPARSCSGRGRCLACLAASDGAHHRGDRPPAGPSLSGTSGAGPRVASGPRAEPSLTGEVGSRLTGVGSPLLGGSVTCQPPRPYWGWLEALQKCRGVAELRNWAVPLHVRLRSQWGLTGLAGGPSTPTLTALSTLQPSQGALHGAARDLLQMGQLATRE